MMTIRNSLLSDVDRNAEVNKILKELLKSIEIDAITVLELQYDYEVF